MDIAQFDLMRVLDYLDDDEQQIVLKASAFGDQAHIKDKRNLASLYITPPMAVAEILGSFRMDVDTIVAAILWYRWRYAYHWRRFDREFGKPVAQIVNGVTKLKSQMKTHQ